jgi:pimeloyl-ACP methyl ester carboxylesterase
MRIFWLILLLLLLALLAAGWWLYVPDEDRAALERRWAGAPSQFVEVAGIRLHLRDTGPRDAPAIILLHGFASSLHAWEGWAPALEARYRMIRIDLPGFGLTGADPAADYSDARAHGIVMALMDRLGLRRATLLGSSMGGRIAWSFAAAHPERTDRLVLLAPDGFASPGIEYGQAGKVPLMLRALPYVLPDAMLRPSIAPAYAQPERIPEEVFQRYRAMMLAPGVRQAIVDRTGGHMLQPPEPLLGRIQAPTLLLWGDQDRMVPPSNARDYLREIPDARLVVLPGVAHVPMEEAPEESVAVVMAFLGGQAADTR